MTFTSPVAREFTIPEELTSVPLCTFMLNECYGRQPLCNSLPPFVCGLSSRSFSALEQKQRTDRLARALAARLRWDPNEGSEYEKVVVSYTYNTIDVMTLHWAVHMLNGVSSPANASYAIPELAHQLNDSGATAIFTCLPLLQNAREAAAMAGIDAANIFVIDLPVRFTGDISSDSGFSTLEELVHDGELRSTLPSLRWDVDQGQRQTAFLCYSSGTSGLPKGVRVSHYNVIANVLQLAAAEATGREALGPQHRDVGLGLMPQSHIYALVIICHAGAYRGDSVIVLPKYSFQSMVASIEQFRINTIYLVPPIISDLTQQNAEVREYDLKSVRKVVTGAAPLGKGLADDLIKIHPSWRLCQGYGLTETATVVTWTLEDDICHGSAGVPIPGTTCRLVDDGGKVVTGNNEPGELLVSSPSVTLGYHNNRKATNESFVFRDGRRWLRTGDIAVFSTSSSGRQHMWIVDRLKELIKVKGLQVAPAELEALLLAHPDVNDAAVIGTPDDRAGEYPKAFIVLSSSGRKKKNEARKHIRAFVEDRVARHKWLRGGIEFIEAIPRNPSGKILRRELRSRGTVGRCAVQTKL
ncbi:hypothetical protein M409DRAFT_31103 [Zasmidium cellare ATCC 36951]|uniref:AMP-dependent synthetase/ligase domain-containing protein n=1 Tax=Zasmidium cellare ATCC 36951 TaxID=1080233 RepID=A0A6A6BWG3_ZASCE|nr:uncharacterized protein M409DRAFT_31103 [Zasmidium cellare ATCC 36951]KAF2158378.1 hypothetical protein M409DRAFT_31103 [Zasmidium cellare ATCC 36951]